MKFKVGDRVKATTNNYVYTTKEMNWEGIVTETHSDYFEAKTTHSILKSVIGHSYNALEYEDFEIAKEFRKYDLQTGDVVTLQNEEKLIYVRELDNFFDISDDNDNSLSDVSDLKDDLTHKYDDESNIIKVERPNYFIVYERLKEVKEDVKEMTLEEVCKELGYEVKIIKEREDEE